MAISIVSSIQEEHITVKYIHIGKTKEALLTSKRRPFTLPFVIV